ncbi:helix-turn-helix domain-containing protein [Microlunatus capsulatus]|uniref:Transcriptional regulator with XRE-family HTH domain n=1 Tax=Microlunatus capsulatus TaxID=99117 RepID=A0ABS4Z9W5_9ACTN|nr:helix-turn-helix transcriptional regulator [Microlunatus capsulatus]MBP2417843.1 transcriptional regulator with XRE-family HTH domain [Microlunatus capsulatus]
MSRIRPTRLGDQLGTVGDFIAAQRRSAELSLRQLAEQTGISNPYLSQIERGLRKPSAEVLQQLAQALRVSAESLYVRAGILDPDDHRSTTVEMAVLADPGLTERQKHVLLEIHTSFVKENERAAADRAEAAPAPNTPAPTGAGSDPAPDPAP